MRARSFTMAVVLTVGFAVAVAAPAPPAQAKPGGGAKLSKNERKRLKKAKKAAKRLDKVGKSAFKKGRFADAAIAFRAAYKEHPNPKFQYNLGKALERSGDLEGAIAAFELYLAEAKEADREGIESGISFLKAKLQETRVLVSVQTTPPAAVLTLQGPERRLTDRTPWAGWLEPGEWKLSVARDGYASVERDLALALGDPVEFELTLPRPGDKTEDPPASATPAPAADTPAEPEPEPAAVPPPPPAEASDGGPGAGVWGSFAVAGAALAAGVVLGLMSNSARDEFDSARKAGADSDLTWDEANDRRDSAATLGLAATAAFGLAGAAAAAGVVIWTW